MLSFFPRDGLDKIWDLIDSVSEGFLTLAQPIREGPQSDCLDLDEKAHSFNIRKTRSFS